MVARASRFAGRTLVLLAITFSLVLVMWVNFGALIFTPEHQIDGGSSSPVAWSDKSAALSRRDNDMTPPKQLPTNKVKCDRGVECDLYTGPSFSVSTLLPDIEHNFPRPPFIPPTDSVANYKGLYRCDVNTGCPTYSAAFLASKSQLLSREIGPTQLENKLTNMESASYHVFGGQGTTAVWTSSDAFDFSVEHISMYERVLKSTDMVASPLKDAVLSAYGQRLTLIERDQRYKCSEGREAQQWHALRSERSKRLGKTTVAVMPFYAVGAGSGHSIRDTKLKYLNITVHSIRCHFDAVVVAVSHELDRKYVLEESGLPIHDVIMLTNLPRPSSTGMFTVKEIQNRLLNSPKWRNFDYVFYTEADQILHLRTTQVFAPLEPSARQNPANRHPNPSVKSILPAILVPHRFHSVPLASDFQHIEHHFNQSDVYAMLSTSDFPERTLTQWIKGGSEKYQKEADPNAFLWYTPSLKRSTIRREMNLYESRPLTRFDAVNDGDSCCFLHERDSESNHFGGLLTPKYYPSKDEKLRPQVATTDVMAIGNGFAMVAGDCCFICTFDNRYCHNTCNPRRGDDSDCGVGSYTN